MSSVRPTPLPDQVAKGDEWRRNVEIRNASLGIAEQSHGIAQGENWNDMPVGLQMASRTHSSAVFQFTATVGVSPNGIKAMSAHLRQPVCRLKAMVMAQAVNTITAIQPARNRYCAGPLPSR